VTNNERARLGRQITLHADCTDGGRIRSYEVLSTRTYTHGLVQVFVCLHCGTVEDLTDDGKTG
jgi:Fe2+ or Zn2+ uptake regulation protein